MVKKGVFAPATPARIPHGKPVPGTAALFLTGLPFTKGYYTMPHDHKNQNEPMTMWDGELHPYENQPKKAAGMRVSKKHEMTD